MTALGATGLSCLCIGAVLGALGTLWFYRRFAEYQALCAYYRGYVLGRKQGWRDARLKLRIVGVPDEPESAEELGRTAQGTDGLGGDASSDEPHVVQ